MPNLDSERRILIKRDLIEKMQWKLPKDVAICYDFNGKEVKIIPEESLKPSDNIIEYKRVDKKGRIFVSKEVLAILNGSTTDSFFVTYIRQNCLYIRKI